LCGSGLGALEFALLAEEAGNHLLMTPFVETASAAWLLGKVAAPVSAGLVLRDVVAGSRLLVPASASLDWHHGAGKPAVRIDSKTATLTGSVPFAPFADSADTLLVDAADGNGQAYLCAVARSEAGVSISTAANVDGSAWSLVSFRGVQVSPENVVGQKGVVGSLVSQMHDLLVLGTAAELLGVTQAALDMTLDYLKVRQQFGKPIGSFQALQHRVVNCYVDIELNRSLLYRVIAAWDGAACHHAMIPAVKARIARCALETVRAALQLHGAIGYTDEHDIGLYYKRAVALAAKYGTELTHTNRFSDLTLPVPAVAR
jgi:3-oxochol-4-en-24-oyl-CoA dehydrogenase